MKVIRFLIQFHALGIPFRFRKRLKVFSSALMAVMFVLSNLQAVAQSSPEQYFVPGMRSPSFVVRNVIDYHKETISREELKGKWVILDFWTRFCSACIAGFPKYKLLKDRFKDTVEIVLIGNNAKMIASIQNEDFAIRRLYSMLKSKHQFNFPAAFDSLMFSRFDVAAVPYIVVLDKEGIVRAVTTSVTEGDISNLISGFQPIMPKAFREHEDRPSRSVTVLDQEISSTSNSILSGAFLTKWTSDIGQFIPNMLLDTGYLQIKGASVEQLYNLAYIGTAWPPDSLYGKYSRWPILEVSDSSNFQPDWRNGLNVYCYFSNIRRRNGIIDKLRYDLQVYFKYNASVQIRNRPYWRLIAIGDCERLLKTKGGSRSVAGELHGPYRATNIPIEDIVNVIVGENIGGIPILNETGIRYNIDISLNCILNDIESLNVELKKYKLQLVKGVKPMAVIVIADQPRKM